MGHAAGVDVGTSNVKVVLVAPDGRALASAARPLHTTTAGPVSTQDAEALWHAVVDSFAEVTAAAPAAAADVAVLGVCSQYSSIVPVDAGGRPLGPMLMWTDTRGSDACWAIMERHPEAFGIWVERHGIPTVGAGLSLSHVLWAQQAEPELHAATTAYLEPMDYVTARLTGRITATQASTFTTQLCDNRTVGVTGYDPDLVAMSGIDASKLPPLVELDAFVGEVRSDVAQALGLPAGVAVLAGMNDSHAGAFATGAFERDRLGVVIGTTAVVLDDVDHHAADLDHEVVSMPAPLPGRYLVWAENGVAGRSVEQALALLDAPFAELDAMVAASAPGAGRVLFLPWLAGSLSPSANRSMRGGWIDVGLESTRADLVRAAVEGTARNLRWLLPHVEAFSGHTPRTIAFGGGAARSPAWAQAIADVLGREVAVLAEPGLAAATAVALVALRRRDGGDPLDAAVPIARLVEPDPSTAAEHEELQAQFEVAFEANLAICQALHPVL
jgi:xylulokinase